MKKSEIDREIAEALLTNWDGTRNALGKTLASISIMGHLGLPIEKTPTVVKLIELGYIVYGTPSKGDRRWGIALHEGRRAHVTDAGRQALANI